MTITLTINNQRVVPPDGATILEAARDAGIRIPTLCHHPDLSNVGVCRMCVVSVERARGVQTACTTPVFEGMVVDTESEEARATRRFVLGMLLSDHPNECMKCEVNGACELQDLVYEYDVPWPEHSGKPTRTPSTPTRTVRLHRPQQVRPVHPLRARLRRDPEPGRVEHRGSWVRQQAGGRRGPAHA